jgi:hypothetical protein
MMTVNQDVILTSAEAVTGFANPVVDIASSALSIQYDVNRVVGNIPNVVSLGFSSQSPQGFFFNGPTIYVMIYR